MSDLKKYVSTCLFSTAALLGGGFPAFAAAGAPSLGTASNFAVLSAAPNGGGAVTCTKSVIAGDVGSSAAPASVKQTNCTISGSIIAPVSDQVLADFNTAYDQYASINCTGSLNTAYTGQAVTLTPGVYCNAAGVTFTDSTLTLDAQGDPNAVWIFKIGTGGSGALTGTNFSVVTANGGQKYNVYWWAAEAVTMTTTGFQGTILAGAAVAMSGLAGTTTPFYGDALAKAAVSLTNVTVSSSQSSGAANSQSTCNQGVGNGPDGCDPGRSNSNWPFGSSDEKGGVPGSPGRKGGNSK